MSTPQAREGVDAAPDDAGIADYLERNPDFFERNPAVLARLRLPHARGGTTVSLVERQVEVLRERQATAEQKLAEFVAVARGNDALAERIQRLSRRLLRAGSLAATLVEIEASMRQDFDVPVSRLVLPGVGGAGLESVPGHFLRACASEEPALRSFETLFATGKPRCGQLRDVQRDFLFGDEAATIGSVALLPLGPGGAIGLLAVGSPDPARFHPGMSTEFLARMGELIGDAIARFR